MNLWDSLNFPSTITSSEYTKAVKQQLLKIISSEDYKKLDSQTIFTIISEKIELVSFHNYFKRFLYVRLDLTGDMDQIPDDVYLDYLAQSFAKNNAPYTFHPTKRKIRAVFHSWLTIKTAKRDTIFIIGFGLDLNDEEVEEFLTKVIKEPSFDFNLPEETIYWYCFHYHQPYAKAKELLEYYKNTLLIEKGDIDFWETMNHAPKKYIHNEQELFIYLSYLKFHHEEKNVLLKKFIFLYNKARCLIAKMHEDSAYIDKIGKHYTMENISSGDVERALYSDIPFSEQGNLMKMSTSLLSNPFHNKRLTRQHISKILRKVDHVKRSDLITLFFFIYAHENEEENPQKRLLRFIDDINDILSSCSMMGIYPPNPYEAFVLLCLASEEPLHSYHEVWKMSYQKEKTI